MPTLSVRKTLYACCPRPVRPYWERVEASPLGARVARGAFWSLAGTVASRGLALVASILVARFLGKDGFGEFSIVQSTVVTFGTFASIGLGLTATRYVAAFRFQSPHRAAKVIAICRMGACIAGGLVSVCLFLMADSLATHALGAPHLADLLRVGCGLVLFTALNNAQLGALSGFEAFKRIASVNFLTGVITCPIMVLGVYWAGIVGALWGLVTSQAVNWALNSINLHREARRSGIQLQFSTDCVSEAGILWRFSLPEFLGAAMVAPTILVCQTIVARTPEGFAELGLFAVAYQWRVLLAFFPGLLLNAQLPILSSCQGERNWRQFRKLIRVQMTATCLLTLGLVAVVMAAVPWIAALYGQDYTGLPLVVILVCSSLLTAAICDTAFLVARSIGRAPWCLAMNAFWCIVMFLTTWLLHEQGAVGLATSLLLAYVAQGLLAGMVLLLIVSRLGK